jgi:glyoxalase family protein
MPVRGIHHVTMLASGAGAHDEFYRRRLGLRRVKVTVNFDAPDVYHLYYGDALGRPGTAMTSFPFPRAARGRRGTGEAAETAFAVPPGSLPFWQERLGGRREARFGEARLTLGGPDGEGIALVETEDGRAPWTGELPAAAAIRGFHSVALALRDARPTAALLGLMGYREEGREGTVTRLRLAQGGNGAEVVDLIEAPGAAPAVQGAGSVHHVAFAVPDRAAQDALRRELAGAGVAATPPIDRDYFWAIYFRSPGGVLFEVATDEPGFARDEAPEALGTALKLPAQHEHLRPRLMRALEPLAGLS